MLVKDNFDWVLKLVNMPTGEHVVFHGGRLILYRKKVVTRVVSEKLCIRPANSSS